MIDQTTILTDAHKRIMNALESFGIGVIEELDFPPYRVDLYLPDYHVIIEVDGPLHNRRQDQKRDKNLYDEYKLYTFRISTRNLKPEYWTSDLSLFLASSLESKEERWEQAELRVPWI